MYNQFSNYKSHVISIAKERLSGAIQSETTSSKSWQRFNGRKYCDNRVTIIKFHGVIIHDSQIRLCHKQSFLDKIISSNIWGTVIYMVVRWNLHSCPTYVLMKMTFWGFKRCIKTIEIISSLFYKQQINLKINTENKRRNNNLRVEQKCCTRFC